jgi:hypothetical protein
MRHPADPDSIAKRSGPAVANLFAYSVNLFLTWCVHRRLFDDNVAARIKPLRGGHLLA